MDEIALILAQTLRWAELIRLGNEAILRHRETGEPIDLDAFSASAQKDLDDLKNRIAAKRAGG